MSHIEKFCSNPNKSTYSRLSNKEFELFYETSKEALRIGKGRLDLAKNIIDFYEGMRYKCQPHISVCDVIKKDRNDKILSDEYFNEDECETKCVSYPSKQYNVRKVIDKLTYTVFNKNKTLPVKPMFTQKKNKEIEKQPQYKLIKLEHFELIELYNKIRLSFNLPLHDCVGKTKKQIVKIIYELQKNKPKITITVGPSFIGLFVEEIIKQILITGKKVSSVYIINLYFSLARRMVGHYKPLVQKHKKSIEDQLLEDMDYYDNLYTWIINDKSFDDLNSSKVETGVEWRYGYIQGHPDLVYKDTVYDVKTMDFFGSGKGGKKNREYTILQVLSYYCLAKQLKKNIKYVGVILPVQKKVLRVDLSNWNWKPFWKILNSGVKILTDSYVDPFVLKQAKKKFAPNVGRHISKSIARERAKKGYIPLHYVFEEIYKGYYQFRLMGYKTPPFQVFLGGNLGGRIEETNKSIKKAFNVIKNNNLTFYTHAPYSINLCREEGCKRPDDSDCKFDIYSPVTQLKRELKYTKQMGGNGVVVHCGKLAGSNIHDGFVNMLHNIENSAKEATDECPILIETGSGVEICSEIFSDDHPYTFVDLYQNLSENTKRVTQVCLDTCHVFAAGFRLMEVIKLFDENNIPIKLIHFNDSKCAFAGKKDRHAEPGEGVIPFQELMNVFNHAMEKGIDLIFEGSM
jgi:endonuclease IV